MRFKDLKASYRKGKPPKIKEGDFLLPYLTPDYIRIGAIPEFFPSQSGVVFVENNELILLWDGSNAGEFFKSKKGILSSTMVKFDKIKGADDDYIFYSLKLQEPILKSKTSGSGIPHVDKDALFDLEIFLPAKEEQITIATILTTIDQAIENTEQLIAKYERIKTGLMQDLLTRGIDERGNIRSEETHEFKDSVLGRIPVEWEVVSISNIAEHIGSGVTPKGGSDVYQTSGIMLLRSQNIYPDGFRLHDVAYISDTINNTMQRSELQVFDVLLNITGASIGRSTFVPEGFVRANVNQHVCAIRLFRKNLSKAKFLSEFLNSKTGQDQISKYNAGSNREGLTWSRFTAHKIPLTLHKDGKKDIKKETSEV